MHILKWELKSNFKSLIIWSVIIIALIIMMMSEFSAYYDNPEMNEMIESMPEQMSKAFSMENTDLTTVEGFLVVASLYFYILLSLYAILTGSNIISKEERDKTCEYLLTMPVSREKIVLSKLIASIINCIFLLGVTTITIILSIQKYETGKGFNEFLGLMILSLFILQMLFLSIGLFLASIIKRYKSSGKIASIILFILYIMNIVSAMNDKLDFMKYITPFLYFPAKDILNHKILEVEFILLSVSIFVIGILGTFIAYPRRDLRL